MNRIPLFKVFMAPAAEEAVRATMASGHVAQGPKVDAFEAKLGELMGAEVTTTSSCTAALDLALHIIGIKAGDEVITTAQTCIATNAGIVLRGAVPVFADIDPRSGLLDPDDVKRNLTRKTKAIMAVDWGGHPCSYSTLRSLGPPVIEDAAHGVGTFYKGRHVAQSGGDFVCFSFQAIKHLTTGDGGALVCPDPARARALRWFGLRRDLPMRFRFEQDVKEVGFKYHMNDIAATIGLENLKDLRSVLGLHRAHAEFFQDRLGGLPIGLPRRDPSASSWLFTITVPERDAFIEKMDAAGVECSPVHTRNDRMTAFARVGRLSQRHAGLDEFASRQVSIPVGWWLTDTDLERVVEAVEGAL
jgi:dTDP-4-amino-4,6-dideoxygalactose transaminase